MSRQEPAADVPVSTGVARAPRARQKKSKPTPEPTGVPRAPRKVSDEKVHSGDGMQVLAYILSGLLFYGGLGWVGDWFFKTSILFPIGLILGVGLAIYMIIKRYGQAQ